MDIFGFIGSIFGYLLWFLFLIFNNYGVAIIFFSIIIKIVMFPMHLKQQRTMAGQAKLSKKQKELQARYANNKAKYQEELQKLYQKEGANPASGCLSTFIPLLIMLGIYSSVNSPLRNTLHIATDKVNQAIEVVKGIVGETTAYIELEIVRNWDTYSDQMTMFDAADIEKIERFSDGFVFLGWDLLKFPSEAGFFEFMWLIPVLSLVTSWGFSYMAAKNSVTAQPGCMKATMYIMPLLSAWWAFTFPAAVGIYWIANQLVSTIQYIVTNKFFSAAHMTSRAEASRFVTMRQNEYKYVELPLNEQNEIAEKIEASKQKQLQSANKDVNTQKSKKKSHKSGKSSNDYLGNKK